MQSHNYILPNAKIISFKDLKTESNNLALAKVVQEQDFQAILTPVRIEILDILRQGILETDDEENEFRRYVLSANEIRKLLVKEKISYNNIYFHLEKMEEMNLIKTVGQIRKGKRYTSYFKRTAHTFIPRGNYDIGNISAIHLENFPDLLQLFSPEIDSNEIQRIIDTLSQLNHGILEKFENWMNIYEEKIQSANLNLARFTELYFALMNLSPEIFEAMMQIKDILHFNVN